MEYLKYRIYINEADYEELVLTNENFFIQIGISKKEIGIHDYKYRMILKIQDGNDPLTVENALLAEQFIFKVSSQIQSLEDVQKIEIEFYRPNLNVHKKYKFEQEDFHELNFVYTSSAYTSHTLLSFIIDSMEQNYRQDDE